MSKCICEDMKDEIIFYCHLCNKYNVQSSTQDNSVIKKSLNTDKQTE